jgi:pSer/pThr/pTyr-binding forkhead associated (FHA) protein
MEKTEIRSRADESGVYPCLEVLTGPRGGGHYRLKTGKNVLGRARECDIVLDDSSVSRRHAVIDVAENGATAADLGSRNGTKVGGQKINQAVSLTHKTRVKIGVYILRFLTGPLTPEEEEGSSVEPEPAEGATEQIPLEGGIEAGEIPMAGQESHLPTESPPAASLQVAAPAKTSAGGRKRLFYLIGGIALTVLLAVSLALALEFFIKGKKSGGETNGDKKIGKKSETDGQVGGVLPAETQPLSGHPPASQPLFLDFSSTPIPAQVFFGGDAIGVSPLRISTRRFRG